eukprot:1104256_1
MNFEMQKSDYQTTTQPDTEAQNASLLNKEGALNNNKSRSRYLLYGLIVAVVIIVALSLFSIIYVVHHESASPSSISTSPICETDACYQLASDIRQSINTSVDPCHDFFHFTCDGWRDQNNWELSKYATINTLGSLNDKQKEVFLNVLTSSSHPLQQHQSIFKAKIFFDSCYISDIKEEHIQSEVLLHEFMSMVNFSDFNINTMNLTQINNAQWDDSNALGFQHAMAACKTRKFGFFKFFQFFKFDIYIVILV